eukprot:TRINITY_DN3036_c0_g1_i5.p1 TRINITY_DN3036_c0_g1~~TRINITY_DN3036_c0_g1_i5.p1  ORF type:complete len:586 (+),score=200.78 TRINITY_DN3036_c0_g1_i5:900-2657(+)
MNLFGQNAGKEDSEHRRKDAQHGQRHLLQSSTSSSSTPVKPNDQPLPLSLPMAPENSTEYTKFKDAYEWLNREAQESLELFLPNSDLRDRLLPKEFDPLQSIHYLRYHNPKDFPRKPNMVYVDPHVLCTPVIADIDNDGHDEMIVAVSYYFDREFYSDPANFARLNDDIDITKYVAGGLVVFDLETRTIKWSVHLDLTTLYTTYRAYIYATPTVVDLTGDGNLNIIVGTSIGFIYAFDHTGKLLRNFPVEMDEIQGQLSVGDVNGDGKLDILAVDNNANMVVWDANGLETWETRLSGFPSQAPSIGDVDGDGILDIVVGTDEGHIWAVRGTDGKVLDGFPVKTGGKILASVLLLRMNDRNKGLHLIVPSFDGYVYVINGESGCGDRIDLGETSFSQVLTDDLTGNGKMDLLVSTMNGNVYAFATQSKYHPLKTWTAQAQGRNGFTYRENYHGIYVLPSSRKNRDMAGFMMTLQFEVVDNRPNSDREREYKVRVSIGGSQTLFEKNYTKPGIYQEQVPCPNQRRVATVLVEMTNEQGQYFSDSFPMSFNMHFYRTLKWFLVVPFVLMGLVLLMSKEPLDRLAVLPQ